MSKIEQLIQQYCPDGVEWKKLGEVGNNLDKKRKPITAGKREAGDTPYYGASGIVDYVKGYIFEGDFLLVSEDGANLITRTYPIAFSVHGKTWVNNHAHVIEFKERATRKYVEHYLNSIDLSPWISSGAQPKLNQENLNNITIPLPPLPVQEEIVKYLDTFSELQAKLQTELQARRRQYDYYQNLLLNKSQFTQHISVGDVCDIIKGKTPIQKARDGIYPLVVTTSERKSCDTYQFNTNAVCIPLVSSRGHGVASLNHVFYQEGKFALGNILCAVIPRETILKAKFLYYYLEYAKDFILVPLMKGGANVSLHSYDIEKVKIPLPTIQEQERIIAILDTFDTLVNDLSQGLPAEIEARRQQYEYYRDKLLSFKKKA